VLARSWSISRDCLHVAGLISLIGSAVLGQGAPRACGVERWPVKVASDADAERVDRSVRRASVAELAHLPRPVIVPQRNRATPFELSTFRVVASVVGTVSEDDGDIHVILGDIEGSSATIVAEVPDSACALGSSRIHDFADAYRTLTTVRRGDIVVLDGIGFFDYLHGQTGVAPNGFELHPVVAARVVGSISTSQPDSARQPVPSEARTTSAVRVWVNTSSGVYHCPGSQWYGTTRRGIYMTESAAAAAGYRPAYNRRCS